LISSGFQNPRKINKFLHRKYSFDLQLPTGHHVAMSLFWKSPFLVLQCLFSLNLMWWFQVICKISLGLIYRAKINFLIFPADDVLKVAEKCEKKGNYVIRLEFEDSSHVNHFDKHSEVYTLGIDQFLKKCIECQSEKIQERKNLESKKSIWTRLQFFYDFYVLKCFLKPAQDTENFEYIFYSWFL